jgi:23S rRNA pseudouridine2605 synthase
MTEQDDSAPGSEGDRIAKVLARAGVASRRDAEKMIAEGRVSVNGEKLSTPAFKVPPGAIIQVDGKVIAGAEPTRLWRYHKPIGLVTSHRDEKGRPTVFQHLPETLPRVISVGRLDLNSEGLLLLTNDGALARRLELPETGWTRRYRVRFFGTIKQTELDKLQDGLTIEGVRYGPIEAALERSTGQNSWASVALKEGKNREVRKVFEHFGLRVSRLLRTAYGPFQLGDLSEGEVAEVSGKVLKEQLGLAKNPNRVTAARQAPRPAEPEAPAATQRGRKRIQTATERNAHLSRGKRTDVKAKKR